jgi:hypothetical protein
MRSHRSAPRITHLLQWRRAAVQGQVEQGPAWALRGLRTRAAHPFRNVVEANVSMTAGTVTRPAQK